MTVRIGIDTGGTFNDFVLIDDSTGEIRIAKSPSTPRDPAAAIRAGLRQLRVPDFVDAVVVGTTVATNAVIERRGPQVRYVTNAGFTDVPFLGRLDKERLYDLHWQRPRPLVQRAACVGVGGRVNHSGEVVEPLDFARLRPFLESLGDADAEETVVAVCCLFSYLHPDHEEEIAAQIAAVRPDISVSTSHEVSPVWREFERANTTIVDAFVKPIVRRYVAGVEAVLDEHLDMTQWSLLGSNGGHLRAGRAVDAPVRLLVSGLAGGVVGASVHALSVASANAFTLDMGGTSADIGLILDGAPQFAPEFELAWGLPVSLPSVSVSTIGAGGGSIAWVDKGGLLHVGPRSAGAEPGPAAYGRGGQDPTVTDANIVLGRLDPGYFLGGGMPLDAGASLAAYERLGSELGMDARQAALASVRTVEENMANAVRLIAVERGLDPRDFALIAFGGAGPLHARAVAARLGITTVLIPPSPGLCSAFGAAVARARVDRVQTCYARSDQLDLARVAALDAELTARVVDELRATTADEAIAVDRVASMRYAGQNYEVEVPLPQPPLDEAAWNETIATFAGEHEALYGFSLPGEVIEMVNIHASAAGPPVEFAASAAIDDDRPSGPHSRSVTLDSRTAECPVTWRATLRPGDRLSGPMIIDELDSTILIGDEDNVLVHDSGVLIVTLGGADDA